MIAKNLIPAAGYIRMSTSKQEDSPERQRAEIELAATKYGYYIVVWFEDHGISGTTNKRPGFQKLLGEAKRGKFKAVIVHEQSRFSREKMHRAFGHLAELAERGVHLVTTRSGVLDISEIGGAVLALVNAHQNHEYSRKIAEMSVGGKILKAKRGERYEPLFGFDREVFNEQGEMVQRVHFAERFIKPKAWKTRLVVSADAAAVDAVRWAFEQYAAGLRLMDVLREFRRRGLKTSRGNAFAIKAIRRMLENPAYAGDYLPGRFSRGQFRQITQGEQFHHEGAHEGIVSRELFREVQQMLKAMSRPQAKTVDRRYVLTKILTCGHCGGVMYGHAFAQRGKPHTAYQCTAASGIRIIPKAPCDVRPAISGYDLEAYVHRVFREQVLGGNLPQVARCVRQQQEQRPNDEFSAIESKLAGLKRTKDGIIEKLVLVEAHPAAMNALLTKLEEIEAETIQLTKRREQLTTETDVRPAALEEIRRILFRSESVHDNDRGRLAAAYQLVIRRIRIWRRWSATNRKVGKYCGMLLGEIEFFPGVLADDQPLTFSDADLKPKLWHRVAAAVRAADQPLSTGDVAAEFPEARYTTIASCLNLAVADGAVVNLGRYKGWAANPDYNPFADARAGKSTSRMG